MSDMQALLYAIRHNPTGHFLPLNGGTKTRGFTYVSPVPMDQQTPRLFRRRQDAESALKWWLMGQAKVLHYRDEGAVLDGMTPDPSRRREEMEVVPLSLKDEASQDG